MEICGDPCPEAFDLQPCQLPKGHGGGWHRNVSSAWPVRAPWYEPLALPPLKLLNRFLAWLGAKAAR